MENNTNQKIEYSAYHRKSTESEDHQILSIDSQIDKSTEMAKSLGIKLKEENIFTESKSAKISNNRPEFRKMVDAIEKGKFTGMMRCGECDGSITAETKTKRPKNGKVHTYVYYHCTKRVHKNCTQGSIEVNELKKQIAKEINSIEIPPEFHSFAMKWFINENEKEVSSQRVVLGANQKAYNASVAKLSGLTDMRASGEIQQEEFSKKQAEYLTEKNKFKKLLDGTDNRIDQWNQTSDEMLTFIERAQERFENGTLQTKRSILSTLGSNLIIKDKIISIDIEKSLFPMKKISIEVKAIKERLEPLDTLEKQKQFEQMCDENPMMCAR